MRDRIAGNKGVILGFSLKKKYHFIKNNADEHSKHIMGR